MGNRLNYYKALKSIITGQQTGTAYSYESFHTHWQLHKKNITIITDAEQLSHFLSRYTTFIMCRNQFLSSARTDKAHTSASVLMLEILCLSSVWPLLTAHFIPTSLPPHSKPALRGNTSVAKSVYSQVTLLSYSKIKINLAPTHLLASNMLFKIF